MTKLERSSIDANKVTVYGNYERDYGRPHIGNITKIKNGVFMPTPPDGRNLDLAKTRSAAVIALETWARENMSAESVERDYENTTAGGQRLTFLRRVFFQHGPSIVAVVHDGEDTCQTSWRADGICSLHQPYEGESKKEVVRRERWKLVRREPAATEELESDGPTM